MAFINLDSKSLKPGYIQAEACPYMTKANTGRKAVPQGAVIVALCLRFLFPSLCHPAETWHSLAACSWRSSRTALNVISQIFSLGNKHDNVGFCRHSNGTKWKMAKAARRGQGLK
jgi:hypothetical protein